MNLTLQVALALVGAGGLGGGYVGWHARGAAIRMERARHAARRRLG
jgi:hypothetical protein